MKTFDYYIFTDGASSGNPGPGGFGAILIHQTVKKIDIKEIGGGEKNTTNNKMEMYALIKSLEQTKIKTNIIVFTDSKYLINGLTIWLKNWKKNGWITTLKKPVENKYLWLELDKLSSERLLTFKYIPGHSGIPLNERADRIATSFYTKDKVNLFTGLKKDYFIKFKIIQFEDYINKNIQNKKQKLKVFSYVSMVDNKISVDKNWSDCQKKVNGKKALYKKVFSQKEENTLKSKWSKLIK